MQGLSGRRSWLPRRAARLLRYILYAIVLGYIIVTHRSQRTAAPATPSTATHWRRRSNVNASAIDFAWGSLLHRFQNHPREAPKRPSFPWKTRRWPKKRRAAGQRVSTLIVTAELEGLHKNGGIGTAYAELAGALAASKDIFVSILIAKPADEFPIKTIQTLRAQLASKRILLYFVEDNRQPIWPQAWTPVAASRVWEWLRNAPRRFDIIHFPDNSGIGYFSVLAKYEGLALQDSKIIVGLHGPEVEWAGMLNKKLPHDRYSLDLGFFERRTAEMADAVVAPSDYILEYLRSRGWQMPEATYVIPNVVSLDTIDYNPASNVQPITELVFFGRLEERKGTRLFIRALELIYSNDSSDALSTVSKITFLGKDVSDVSTRSDTSALIEQALKAIHDYTDAEFEIRFIKKAGREEALTYLQHPSRLAVIPALADNSPSTVLECISHSIRFIASSVGGIPELIHQNDVSQVLFAPLPQQLARKLSDVTATLAINDWMPVRPRAATQTAADDWRALHRWVAAMPGHTNVTHTSPLVSICITHYERPHLINQLLKSLVSQSFTNIELILVDDGSTTPKALEALEHVKSVYFASSKPHRKFLRIDNSYLGEARNRAAELATGEWLLFLDDDDVLKPHALETLVNVAARTNVSALSTWLDEFASDVNPLETNKTLPHRRTFWFPGQSIAAGAFYNCFGSGNIFVKRTAFDAIGGFSTYRDIGAEDWEFWMRLALGGHPQLVVPEELIFARSDPSRWSMKYTMDPWDSAYHAMVPLLNDERVTDLGLGHALLLARAAGAYTDTPVAHADSQSDFELVQNWAGWSYHFEAVDEKPKLIEETEATLNGDQWMFDRDPTGGYLSDSMQMPHIAADGGRYAAIRAYRSPKIADVAVELTYHAGHQCGDGTHLVLMWRPSREEPWQDLTSFMTMDEGSAEFHAEITLQVGSDIVLWSDPLQTVECDNVEVHLWVYPLIKESLHFSTLAKKAQLEANAGPRRGDEDGELDEDDDDDEDDVGKPTWAVIGEEDDDEDEDDTLGEGSGHSAYHLALIFDRNRFEHFKQVIRSANHFITSRKLVVHAVAPEELHSAIHEFMRAFTHSLRTYDHSLCYEAAARVMGFSDPQIHVSAHCKMFLADVLDDNVHTVLYLDTDITIASDISSCYPDFKTPSALMSMAVDMGDVCQIDPDMCWPIGLHWKLPLGLECGDVAGKPKQDGQLCPQGGEIETLQVNGGVALMQLDRMRKTMFTKRYVESIVHHYRLAGRVARWGEQDFINSYFRLSPAHLEMLPCGCNYQWFGARSEVKCGRQPIVIAHHWAHGIVAKNDKPFNVLYHHFLETTDSGRDEPLPAFPDTVPANPLMPSTTPFELVHSPNCPRQSYDCSAIDRPATQYGERVIVLSRVISEQFVADLFDSVDVQTYPAVDHRVIIRPSVRRPIGALRRIGDMKADIEQDYEKLCERCGELTEPGAACTTSPVDLKAREDYFQCACGMPDSTSTALAKLEAEVRGEDDSSWILYLDDNRVFVDKYSLSILMAHATDRKEMLLFRSNTSSSEAQRLYKKKVFSQSELEGVGYLFHASALDIIERKGLRCDAWRTLNSLSSHLRLKWVDAVPTVSHPLQRHLPLLSAEDFKLTVVLYESPMHPSWTKSALDVLQSPALASLIQEVVVASFDAKTSSVKSEARVVTMTQGTGLVELAPLVETEGVLLLSDNVVLDKAALVSMLTFWLDDPLRLVGIFSETDEDYFSPALNTNDDLYGYIEEVDPIIGASRFSHLLPRALMAHSSHFEALTTTISASLDRLPPLHARCHPLLLSALASNASDGQSPLRVLPPPATIVDRVSDCRLRQYLHVTLDPLPGDNLLLKPVVGSNTAGEPIPDRQNLERTDEQVKLAAAARAELQAEEHTGDGEESHNGHEGATDADEAEDDNQDEEMDDDDDQELAQAEARRDLARRHRSEELQGDGGPTFAECVSAIDKILGGTGEETSPQWLVYGADIGIAGARGIKQEVVKGPIDDERWLATRRMESCQI